MATTTCHAARGSRAAHTGVLKAKIEHRSDSPSHLCRGPVLQTVLLRNPFACHRQTRYESPRPLTECMPLADSRADSWGIPILVHAWTHPGGDPPPVPPQAAAGVTRRNCCAPRGRSGQGSAPRRATEASGGSLRRCREGARGAQARGDDRPVARATILLAYLCAALRCVLAAGLRRGRKISGLLTARRDLNKHLRNYCGGVC